MPEQLRTIVNGLPWKKDTRDHERANHNEVWDLDIDNVGVWVKDYGENTTRADSPFRGWRIGRGGSPLSSLNGGEPWPSREAAMHAARRVAHITARDRLVRAHGDMATAIAALTDVLSFPEEWPQKDEAHAEGDRIEFAYTPGDSTVTGTYVAPLADGRHLIYGGYGDQRTDSLRVVEEVFPYAPDAD